jgi:hypothetical protein
VKAVSDRRRKRDAVYGERRKQVFERGRGMCEFCEVWVMEQVHHQQETRVEQREIQQE